MTDREKLVEIIATARRAMWSEHIEGSSRLYKDHFFADFLLAHGVTIREQGEWVWDSRELQWECSRCGCIRAHDLVLGLDASFCGKCGAPMKGESK